MIEYLIVTAVLAISAGMAVKMMGAAMARFFSSLVAFISLPIP